MDSEIFGITTIQLSLPSKEHLLKEVIFVAVAQYFVKYAGNIFVVAF